MFIKSKIILPQAEANLAECSDPVLGPLVLLVTNTFKLFQSFDFECTRWTLFQKRGMCTKFDIYIFICKPLDLWTQSISIAKIYYLGMKWDVW
jgi:hypothetical protein